MPAKGRRKRVPQRTCIICRKTLGKRELNRIVRAPEGVQYDPTGKMPGRGAYLCADPACWQRALSGNALDRALKTALTAAERHALENRMNVMAGSSERQTPQNRTNP